MDVQAAGVVPRPVPRALRSRKMPVELLDSVRIMLKGGATDQEMCTVLGIPLDTLYGWREESPALASMMQAYKNGYDIRIERALAQSAIGYTYESEEIKVIDGKVTRIPIAVHVQPNVTAQVFWLKNRKPWMWRDRHELDVKGDLTVTEVPDDRRLAMQMLALLREAQKNATPMIEGTTNADVGTGAGRQAEPAVDDQELPEPPAQGRRRRFA